MAKWGKVLQKAERNPAGLKFDELTGLLKSLGFQLVGGRGSHATYRHPKGAYLNVQNSRGMAKEYQVKQLLDAVKQHNLEV